MYVAMCYLYINFFILDSTLDFLRPGDFASKLKKYLISKEENVTLIMDNFANNYSEEISYRVCRNDVSPIKQSVSCCHCHNSKDCKWGLLKSSSSPQHICLFMASRPGLYWFEIYTSHFPCYQKIGGPFRISKHTESEHIEEKHKETTHITPLYIIIGILFMAVLLLLFGVVLVCIKIKYKGKPM